MIINTFSYIWSATAVDAMCELTKHGYRVFEVPICSPHCWPDEMTRAVRSDGKKRLQDCGASVRCLNAGGFDINLASPAANMRRKSTDHIKSAIELAYDWGATEMVISPGIRRPMISPSLPKTFGWLYESLDVLLPRAEQAGVRLLFENTPFCFRPTFDEMLGLVKEVNSENLKIVYDVANAAYIKEDPVSTLLSGQEAIGLVHISDTGVEEWGHDPIGTGVIDWVELAKAVESTCKVENVVLEIIREDEPLGSINTGIAELKKRGWNLQSLGPQQ